LKSLAAFVVARLREAILRLERHAFMPDHVEVLGVRTLAAPLAEATAYRRDHVASSVYYLEEKVLLPGWAVATEIAERLLSGAAKDFADRGFAPHFRVDVRPRLTVFSTGYIEANYREEWYAKIKDSGLKEVSQARFAEFSCHIQLDERDNDYLHAAVLLTHDLTGREYVVFSAWSYEALEDYRVYISSCDLLDRVGLEQWLDEALGRVLVHHTKQF
jgi:hypothetical protein